MKYAGLVVVCLVVLVGGIVGWFLVQQNRNQKEVAPLPEPTPLEAEGNALRIAVEGHGAKVTDLQHTDTGWIIRLETETRSSDLEQILADVADIHRSIGQTKAKVADVQTLVRTSELKDVYGRTLEKLPIVRIELPGDTFAAVDWKGFEPLNFNRIAALYWVHDEIEKIWAEKEAQKQKAEEEGGGSKSGAGTTGQ